MGPQSHLRFTPALVLLSALLVSYVSSESPPNHNQASKKIDVSDNKLKRQNEATGGRGEEVDLSTIPVSQPGAAGAPQQPGQTPFFAGGNPFLQQPYFGNGINFQGVQGVQQPGFPTGQQPGFPGQQAGGFPAGFANSFPTQGFPQGYPQFGLSSAGAGRNVILQNNGKQYLVQELNDQQRVVQKNGKQYLLQPFAGSNPVLGGLQTFNVPNSALSGLSSPFGSSGALGSLGALSSLSGASDGTFPSNSFPRTSSAPQRLLLNSQGQQLQVEQLPIRSGVSPYFSPGGVSSQLAQQGQQYAGQFSPFGLQSGLSQAYSRANDAGYGLYSTGRDGTESGQSPLAKRNVIATSKEERNKSRH